MSLNTAPYKRLRPGSMFTRLEDTGFGDHDQVYLKLEDGRAVLVRTGKYYDIPGDETIDWGHTVVHHQAHFI